MWLPEMAVAEEEVERPSKEAEEEVERASKGAAEAEADEVTKEAEAEAAVDDLRPVLSRKSRFHLEIRPGR